MILRCYETERLSLELPCPELAPQILDYYLRNREFLKPFDPVRDEGFFSIEQMQKDIAADQDALARGTLLRFWIRPKGDEKVIGTVALSNIVYGAFLSCFLGYKLDGAALRMGYMTEAAGQLIRIAFSELGLHRIEANIMPRNLASLGVARKLGFEDEGTSPKYLRINGVWEDHTHMVLRNRDME